MDQRHSSDSNQEKTNRYCPLGFLAFGRKLYDTVLVLVPAGCGYDRADWDQNVPAKTRKGSAHSCYVQRTYTAGNACPCPISNKMSPNPSDRDC